MDDGKKKERWQRIEAQLAGLMARTADPIARMATVAALLYHKLDYFFWCGFYRLVDGELLVGPYQGPLACAKLEKSKGVCWAGINGKESIVVPDVHKFPGHIACDSRSQSEIVVPVFNKEKKIVGVLDVDSDKLDTFSATDQEYLERIVALIFS